MLCTVTNYIQNVRLHHNRNTHTQGWVQLHKITSITITITLKYQLQLQLQLHHHKCYT